jgi:5-methylcytosine-specific restriction endonuclease McrA
MDIYCSICGVQFTPKDRDQRLCSWQCRGKWAALTRPPRVPVERPCSICGAPIQSKGRNLAYCETCRVGPERACEQCGTTFRNPKPRTFCSVACRNRYIGQHSPTGSDHPNYKGVNRPYATHEWFLVRKLVRDRDDWRCRECGLARPAIKRLHVHHLVSRADWGNRSGHADDPANLITLCTGCHRKRHPRSSTAMKAGWVKRRARVAATP